MTNQQSTLYRDPDRFIALAVSDYISSYKLKRRQYNGYALLQAVYKKNKNVAEEATRMEELKVCAAQTKKDFEKYLVIIRKCKNMLKTYGCPYPRRIGVCCDCEDPIFNTEMCAGLKRGEVKFKCLPCAEGDKDIIVPSDWSAYK
jgi:hypothetical protein